MERGGSRLPFPFRTPRRVCRPNRQTHIPWPANIPTLPTAIRPALLTAVCIAAFTAAASAALSSRPTSTPQSPSNGQLHQVVSPARDDAGQRLREPQGLRLDRVNNHRQAGHQQHEGRCGPRSISSERIAVSLGRPRREQPGVRRASGQRSDHSQPTSLLGAALPCAVPVWVGTAYACTSFWHGKCSVKGCERRSLGRAKAAPTAWLRNEQGKF